MRAVALLSTLAIGINALSVDLWVADPSAQPQCYRQPLLVVINATHLVAIAEGRDNGALCSAAADGKNSSIWRRTSSNGGLTWSPSSMIFLQPPQPDYLSAVYDAARGRVLLQLMTSPNLQLTSDDAGATWSAPQPVKISVPAGYSATPGVAHGIQIDGALCPEPTCGGAAGRLVVAWVCHAPKASGAVAARAGGDVACPGCFSCLATSDDGGASWAIAPRAISTQEGSREASLVQLKSRPGKSGPGAIIYATERNLGNESGHRWHAVSTDSGASFDEFGLDPSIPDVDTPDWTGIVAGATRVGNSIFIATPMAPATRADLALYRSYDEAVSWGAGNVFLAGPAGYSDAGALNATLGALVFENGATQFAGKITFATFQA